MYTLTLEITKRCNLKCRYCYVQKNEDFIGIRILKVVEVNFTGIL